MEKLAVIKIRSSISKSNLINKSLRVLGLKKLYSCTIINDSEVNRGILKNIESVITYGEIDANTLSKLLIKRGMISNKKRIAASEQDINAFCDSFLKNEKKLNELGIKNMFNLHPPIKGFEKKGKKAPFSLKGAFGYRGKEINNLLERMI
ncbi:MAG: 50S ribosomal protein L30P [Candidatus Parvarchaeum acidophilus ARMAN-5]|jgi:large subunit ribosomal protein L30|uniref:50S ribosomal protein L30P n=1 Tax=Candidatus Parvarchaeum acidophilus ARMAN-5 TaxID=662762 RepID=D6GWX8_PARA5|nr:MAG: 50S ribosomal protein L30P [Candidatus Parvarchaeum acidophilus ARMAN-5]